MNRPTGSGSFNQKITIVDRQTMLDIENGSKTFDDSLVIAKRVWCNVKYIGTPSAGASEDRTEEQRTGKVKIEAKMRFRDDFYHDDVVVFMGGLFNIYSIQERGRDELTIIRAESRDDDTYRIGIADGYSEDFYLENPLGYIPTEEEELGDINTDLGLKPYGENEEFMYLEVDEFESPQLTFDGGNYFLELPIEWFYDYSKSGLINDKYRNTTIPAFIDGEEEEIPEEILPEDGVYETFGDINQSTDIYGGIVFPFSNDLDLHTRFVIDINPSYKCGFPMIINPGDMSIPNTEEENQAISGGWDDNWCFVKYNRSYFDAIGSTSGVIAYYNPVVALRPNIDTTYSSFYNPSFFGLSNIECRINLRKYITSTETKIKTLTFTTKTARRVDMPCIDFRFGGITRYYQNSVNEYTTLNEDLSRDFNETQSVSEKISSIDYWDVTTDLNDDKFKFSFALRYGNKMGGLPYTVQTTGVDQQFYPINIHHKFMGPYVNMDYINQYYNDTSLQPQEDGWQLKRSLSEVVTTLGIIDTDYVMPNVALEDLHIRLKNPRVTVKKLNLPDDYVEGDDLVYEDVEYNISAYEVDPLKAGYSSLQMELNHMNQVYVFDNIPSEVRDEKNATCIVTFDIEYDLRHHIHDEDPVAFITHDRENLITPTDDQYFEDYISIITDTDTEFTASGVMEKRNLFPFTVTHKIRIEDATNG